MTVLEIVEIGLMEVANTTPPGIIENHEGTLCQKGTLSV